MLSTYKCYTKNGHSFQICAQGLGEARAKAADACRDMGTTIVQIVDLGRTRV